MRRGIVDDKATALRTGQNNTCASSVYWYIIYVRCDAVNPDAGDDKMTVRIHDLNNWTTYIATSADDCKDSTDLSVYKEVCDEKVTITMGKVIGEYISDPKFDSRSTSALQRSICDGHIDWKRSTR